MNTEEYISSGILELYVMGALSAEENAAVENVIAQDPAIKEELMHIEAALKNFAMGLEKFPRPNMKTRIMNAIVNNEQQSVPVNIKKEAVIKNLYKPIDPISYKYAAACAFGILLAGNIFFIYKWQSAETQLSETIAQNYRLAENYKFTKNIQEKVLADYTVATDHNFKIIELKGKAISPTACAYVHWNPITQETFIDVRKLPVPDSDKQYQLWALVNGKPVDAGVFDLAPNGGLQKVKKVEGAQAFAVTLEKRGGSAAPTMSAMYLMAQL